MLIDAMAKEEKRAMAVRLIQILCTAIMQITVSIVGKFTEASAAIWDEIKCCRDTLFSKSSVDQHVRFICQEFAPCTQVK